MDALVAVGADRDQLEEQFVAEVGVGQMMDLRRLRVTAALAEAAVAFERFGAFGAPGVGLQVSFVFLIVFQLTSREERVGLCRLLFIKLAGLSSPFLVKLLVEWRWLTVSQGLGGGHRGADAVTAIQTLILV